MLHVGGVLFLVKRTENYTLLIWNCKCLTLDERRAYFFSKKINKHSLRPYILGNSSNVTESVIYNYYNLNSALSWIVSTNGPEK